MNSYLSRIDPEQQKLMLVDWVNSLDIASCTLVDSLEDLKSGCVVADILSYIKDHPIQNIQRTANSRAQVISNWSAIIKELKYFNPPSLPSNPQDFLQNTQILIDLLNFLSTLKKEPQHDVKSSFTATKTSEHSNNPTRLPPRNPIRSPSLLSRDFEETPQHPPDCSFSDPKPLNESVKENLLKWLEELNVLRSGKINTEVISSISRTGVLFCDVVNRVEGKAEVVKGVERNPKNKTQAIANVNKALEYLRNFPRMNSRYLWSAKEVIEGNEAVVWGLLEDLKAYYCPAKPRHSSASRLPRPPSSSSVLIKPEDEVRIPKSFLLEKSKVLRSYSASMRRSLSRAASSSPKHSRPTSSSSRALGGSDFYITEEMKKNALEWVNALGIEYEPSSNPYTDPLKNGVLLCELMRLLDCEPVYFNIAPRSKRAVCENFEKALNLFHKNHPDAPNSALNTPNNMSMNPAVVFAFIYSLMLIFPNVLPFEYQEHPLPYGAVGIKRLEKATISWITSLDILHPSPSTFQEIIPELRTGVLLCVIVSRSLSIRLPNIIKDPKTEQSSMNNIRKALDALKNLPNMSQKHVWRYKEVLKGSYGVLLGLLEDVRRCVDGLPARKLGDGYYKDGPYLGSKGSHIRTMSWPRNAEGVLNATFGSYNSPSSSNALKKE